ncbi:unnamed protein product [Fusarium fujikuroi]|nr:unnamed protein product [Fusarium fujikuroi]
MRSVVVSAVVVVISVEDSEVVSSELELASSDEVSEVESPEVSVVVLDGSSDVLASELDVSNSVEEGASVLESLEERVDWMVTDESKSSEETMVDVSESTAWEETEADVSAAWEVTVVEASELKVEVGGMISSEEIVENTTVPDADVDASTLREEAADDTEPNVCEEATADVSTFWDEAELNAAEPDVSGRERELNSVGAAVSAVVGSSLLKIPELTLSAVLASVERAKAEVEVSKQTSRSF